MASSDNFESKVAEIVSFTKQIFSGEEGLKKTKLLETLKDIVAEQEDKSKPKCKKRRISEVISELEDNESVKIQKKGRHYIIVPKKNSAEPHDVDLLDVSLICYSICFLIHLYGCNIFGMSFLGAMAQDFYLPSNQNHSGKGGQSLQTLP